jgi:hypothetical protein
MTSLPDPFVVIEVPRDVVRDAEAMGTKPKFWFDHAELGRCLYKQGHPATGEDWAEKVAASLCELLSLPHARYELATWAETYGVISPSFLPAGATPIPGNEVMLARDPSYPHQQRFRVKRHTIETVFSEIDLLEDRTPLECHLPQGIVSASQTFVGYLLLDAWVGNTDRHHENWSFVRLSEQTTKTKTHLAPTHDHAASMGRFCEMKNDKHD